MPDIGTGIAGAGLVGNLFGGSKKQKVKTDNPAFNMVAPEIQANLQDAQELYQQGGPPIWDGPRVAELNPLITGAIEGAEQYGGRGAGAGLVDAGSRAVIESLSGQRNTQTPALGNIDRIQSQNYQGDRSSAYNLSGMNFGPNFDQNAFQAVANNPHLKQMMEDNADVTLRNLKENDILRNSQDATAVGQVGGTRAGIADALAIRDATDAISRTNTGMLNNAFNQATAVGSQYGAQDAQQRLQAGLADQATDYQFNDLNSLNVRDHAQRLMDTHKYNTDLTYNLETTNADNKLKADALTTQRQLGAMANAPNMMGMGFGVADQMMNYGNYLRNYDQSNINADINTFNENAQRPFANNDWYGGRLTNAAGMNAGKSSTTSQPFDWGRLAAFGDFAQGAWNQWGSSQNNQAGFGGFGGPGTNFNVNSPGVQFDYR